MGTKVCTVSVGTVPTMLELYFRPMVMPVGQYSTGKTTFIRYLLEQDFPGIRIGPEPTTDRYRTYLPYPILLVDYGNVRRYLPNGM